jgi:hypothetical protein
LDRLERVADLRDRDRLDALGRALEVVERQTVPADRRQVVEDLAVGVDAQREAADEVLLRGLQLGSVGPSATKRSSVSRTTFSASSVCAFCVCSPITNGRAAPSARSTL